MFYLNTQKSNEEDSSTKVLYCVPGEEPSPCRMAKSGSAMARLLFLAALVGTVMGTQVLYQPDASDTFVAHKELPFTVQYAGKSICWVLLLRGLAEFCVAAHRCECDRGDHVR